MASCCEPRDYDLVFGSRQAERDAARFRRRGLRWAPRRTEALYRDGTITGSTLLEVGGGVGDLCVALLRAGVEHAVNVELSTAYEPTAGRLLADTQLAGRSVHVVGDFAARPTLADPADLVVLHSVVCCYPDAEQLMAAAASRTLRHLVVSYPRDTWWLRAWAPVQNLYPRVRGSDFRFRIHPHAVILDPLRRAGLRLVLGERNRIDHLAVFSRLDHPLGPAS